MTTSRFSHVPKSSSTPWWAALTIAGIVIVTGFIAAIFGGVIALALTAAFGLLALTVKDFRLGLIILVLMMPFQNTAFLPSTTGFNLNYYFSVITFAVLFFGLSNEAFAGGRVSKISCVVVRPSSVCGLDDWTYASGTGARNVYPTDWA